MVFLVNLARVVFAPLLDTFMRTFAMTPATAGLIATLVWFGSALPRIPTGLLLTRVPRHHVVLGTGVVLTLASAFTATAGSPLVLGVGALLMGLASGAYFIAANPLVSELYPERVGRVIGIHGTASQLAAVVAPLFVGGVLLLTNWRAVFVTMAVVALAATLVLYRVASRSDALPDAGSADRHFLRAARRQWPIILSGVAILGGTGFVWNGLFNFYIKYLIVAKDLPQPVAQTMLTVVFAAGVPAFWLSGRMADRFPHVPLMLAILGGFIVSLLALSLSSGLVAVVAVSLVLGYVIHSLFPAMDTYLLDSLPDENRASAYAVYSGAAMVVQAAGSWTVGGLLDVGYSYDAIFQGFAVVLVVVLGVLVVLHRANRLPSGATPS